MNEHINRVGCSNPYQNQNKPLCTNATQMKASRYDLNIIRYGGTLQPKPCQEMTNIEIQYIELGTTDFDTASIDNGSLKLTIEYPFGIKMITQANSVDLHALIGYIGLFLGTNCIKLPFR